MGHLSFSAASSSVLVAMTMSTYEGIAVSCDTRHPRREHALDVPPSLFNDVLKECEDVQVWLTCYALNLGAC